MNKETLKGNWKQFEGAFKTKWGRLTDDEIREAEGDYDRLLGKLMERYGERKEEIKDDFDDWIDSL